MGAGEGHDHTGTLSQPSSEGLPTLSTTSLYGQGWSGAFDSSPLFDMSYSAPQQQRGLQGQASDEATSSSTAAPTGNFSHYQAADLAGPSSHFVNFAVGPPSSAFEQRDYDFNLLQQPPSRETPHQQSSSSQVHSSQQSLQYQASHQPHVSQLQPIYTSPPSSASLSGSNDTLLQKQQQQQQQPPLSGQSLREGKKTPRPPRLHKIYAAPIESPRSLADVAPIQTFLSVIAIYFQHLYPLMPLVHRPTFAYDLINRRDEKDQAFLAFVLSLSG